MSTTHYLQNPEEGRGVGYARLAGALYTPPFVLYYPCQLCHLRLPPSTSVFSFYQMETWLTHFGFLFLWGWPVEEGLKRGVRAWMFYSDRPPRYQLVVPPREQQSIPETMSRQPRRSSPRQEANVSPPKKTARPELRLFCSPFKNPPLNIIMCEKMSTKCCLLLLCVFGRVRAYVHGPSTSAAHRTPSVPEATCAIS